MTTFRIKLVETSTTEGTAEFAMVGHQRRGRRRHRSPRPTASHARRTLPSCTLPDGQSSIVEPCEVTVERATRIVLVDEDGLGPADDRARGGDERSPLRGRSAILGPPQGKEDQHTMDTVVAPLITEEETSAAARRP